jgi:hypothetical protein
VQGIDPAWVFAENGNRLGELRLARVLRRMGLFGAVTAHGFRLTFRDWAAEFANFPRELAEQSLAHANGDKVEAAYKRGDQLEKRRKLMEAWSRFCTAPVSGANVVPLRCSANNGCGVSSSRGGHPSANPITTSHPCRREGHLRSAWHQPKSPLRSCRRRQNYCPFRQRTPPPDRWRIG